MMDRSKNHSDQGVALSRLARGHETADAARVSAEELAARIVGISEADLRREHQQAADSLARSHILMDQARWVPCSTHRASPGEYCWGSAASGVRGTCMPRISLGVRDAERVTKQLPRPPHMIVHNFVARPLPKAGRR